MGYTDSHVHLIDYMPERISNIVQRMRKKRVDFALAVSVNLESSEKTLKLAETYKEIKAAIGLHPWFTTELTGDIRSRFEKLAAFEHASALGEIGLDYAPPAGHKPAKPGLKFPENMPPLPAAPPSREVQKETLAFQLSVARKYGLPVNIHCEEAHKDMMDVLRQSGSGITGIAHSFQGSQDMLDDWLALGFLICPHPVIIMQYPPDKNMEDIVRAIPAERLAAETDANPMLSPENGPLEIIPIVRRIAEIRGSPAGEIAETCTTNLKRLLKIK